MKTYYESDNNLEFEGMFIPKDPGNRHYQEYLELTRKGECTTLPKPKPLVSLELLRSMRDAKLSETDWVMNSDVYLSNITELYAYRQALRDFTTNYIPVVESEIVWPIKPSTTVAPYPYGPDRFFDSVGFGTLVRDTLINLLQVLKDRNITIPPKMLAVQEWTTACTLAYASGTEFPPMPFTYPEVLAEVLPLLAS